MSTRTIFRFVATVLVFSMLAACAPAAPQVVERTVVVPLQQTVVVEKPVQQTVVVEQTVMAPTAKTTVTLSYNRFFKQSFGPGPAPLELIQQAVAKKYPEIDVQLNLAPDDMGAWHDAMSIWITAEDSTIDLFGMDTPWVPEFGAAGWAVPLNEYFPDLAETFDTGGLNLYTYDGQTLAVPFWTAINGLYYRTDLLEQYGYEPPETWDELVAISQAITADDPALTGYVWAGGKSENLTMAWTEFLYAFGGRYWDDQGNCAFNSPEGVQAVEFMKWTVDSGLSGPETTTFLDNVEPSTRFAAGNAVFLRGPSDYLTWLNDPNKSAVAGVWDFMQNPAQPGGIHAGSSGGFGLAVQPYTHDLEAALKVMEAVTTQEVQKGFAIAWGPVQYYKGLYEDPDVKHIYPEAHRLDKVLASALARPGSSNYAQLSSIIQDEVHAAITGVKPVKQALDDACSAYSALP